MHTIIVALVIKVWVSADFFVRTYVVRPTHCGPKQWLIQHQCDLLILLIF